MLVALAVGACNDFDSPPELVRPSVLTVLVEPPAPALGESATITVVTADATGLIPVDDGSWTIVSTYPGVAPMGSVSGVRGQATYTAPSVMPQLPENALPIDTLEINLTFGGRKMRVLKAVGVRTPDMPEVSNPTITALSSNGAAVTDGITARVGEPLTLALEATLTGDPRYAWYVPLGTIEKYQSSPTEYIADKVGQGTLIGVVRDAVGSDYVAVPLTVTE